MLLLIAATDPTGLSGLTRDVATATDLGVPAACVVTAAVSENSQGVQAITWRDPKDLAMDLKLVLAENAKQLRAVKIGLIGTDQLQALWPKLRRLKLPVVIDPVLEATSGAAFHDNPMALAALLGEATLTTPNRHEALLLTGRKRLSLERLRGLGQHVLVKSAEQHKLEVVDWLLHGESQQLFAQTPHRDDARGTGCTLATAAAVHLGRGQSVAQAVLNARAYLAHARALVTGNRLGLVVAPRGEVLEALSAIVPRLERLPSASALAEVGMNVAYCLPGATQPEHTAAFTGRITARHGRLHVGGYPAMGASAHVARVALQAHQLFPDIRAAMNVRFNATNLQLARDAGLKGVSFDRAKEPKTTRARDGHTMDWGVREACKGKRTPPDFIHDKGGVGKEPMIRLLGRDPHDLLNKLEALLGLGFLREES